MLTPPTVDGDPTKIGEGGTLMALVELKNIDLQERNVKTEKKAI